MEATLILSEMLGKLGKSVAVKDCQPEKMADMILDMLPQPVSGQALELARENREMKIDAQVGKKITPVIGNELKQIFCGEKAFIFSQEFQPDAFDVVMKIIDRLPDLDLSEQSGKQVLSADLDQYFNKPDPYKAALAAAMGGE